MSDHLGLPQFIVVKFYQYTHHFFVDINVICTVCVDSFTFSSFLYIIRAKFIIQYLKLVVKICVGSHKIIIRT